MFCSGILWFKTRWYTMGEKCSSALHSQHAVLLFCSQTLFIACEHIYLFPLVTHIFSLALSPFSSDRPSDIFLLPFPSILLPIPSATLLSSCLTWLDPVSFLPSLLLFPNPLLPDPYPWWHHLEYSVMLTMTTEIQSACVLLVAGSLQKELIEKSITAHGAYRKWCASRQWWQYFNRL